MDAAAAKNTTTAVVVHYYCTLTCVARRGPEKRGEEGEVDVKKRKQACVGSSSFNLPASEFANANEFVLEAVGAPSAGRKTAKKTNRKRRL